MLINLKTYAAKAEEQAVSLELGERLPSYISPCTVSCQFKVESQDSYYVIKLDVDADLMVTCQRCLTELPHRYHNQTILAICNSDRKSTRLNYSHECASRMPSSACKKKK